MAKSAFSFGVYPESIEYFTMGSTITMLGSYTYTSQEKTTTDQFLRQQVVRQLAFDVDGLPDAQELYIKELEPDKFEIGIKEVQAAAQQL